MMAELSSSSNRNSTILGPDQVEEVVSAPERGTLDGRFQEDPLQVSDGFALRPNQAEDNLTAQSSLDQSQSVPPHLGTNSALVSPASSTTPGRSKADEATDSFALQHDGQSQHVAEGSSRTEKTGEGTGLGGALNPEYPLQMGSLGSYVGDGFNSLLPEGFGLGTDPSRPGTAMTQNLAGGHRDVAAPQHPYALYPQNTSAEENSISPVSPISFGFSGPHQAFHGQQSPAGVPPQSVLGLDEQLPPYTRYPSTLPRGNTNEQGTSPTGVTGSPDDGVALGESEIPQPSINNSESQITTHSAFSDISQQRLADLEKPANLSKSRKIWVATRKKRVCFGKLPLWGLLLCFVMLILVVALAMGIIMGKSQHQEIKKLQAAQQTAGQPASTVYATTTTTYDASLLLTPPTDLPGLPFGTYLLTLGDPDAAETNCLTDSQHFSAWSCDLSVKQKPEVLIQVTPAQATSPNLIKISAAGMYSAPVKYGTQPPSMYQPQNLSVAVDQTDMNAGPAFVFQASYNKLVILDNETFNARRKAKRAMGDYAPRRSGTVLQPNDRPWYCYWNNTILEGFIYVTQNVLSSPNSTSSATSLTTTSSDPSYTFPSYPKLVKLEERRDPVIQTDIKPYCQQMQVLDNMALGPATNPDTNEKIIVWLNETDPVYPKLKRSVSWETSDHPHKWTQRNYDSEHCLCEWSNR